MNIACKGRTLPPLAGQCHSLEIGSLTHACAHRLSSPLHLVPESPHNLLARLLLLLVFSQKGTKSRSLHGRNKNSSLHWCTPPAWPAGTLCRSQIFISTSHTSSYSICSTPQTVKPVSIRPTPYFLEGEWLCLNPSRSL